MGEMNLPEALVYSDIRHLNQIADFNRMSVNTASKNSLIQSILQKLNDTHFVLQRLEELTDYEERFLLTVLLENKKRFTIEDLIAKANIVLRIESTSLLETISARGLIQTLLKNGWLYVDQRGRQQLYFIPEDLKLKLIKGLKRYNASLSVVHFDTAFLQSNMLLDDMVTFIRYVSETTVFLTNEGAMHKRHQQEIFKRLCIPETTVDGKQWRFGYGRRFPNYPNRFAFMYDYLFEKGFIHEEVHMLSCTENGYKLLQGDTKLDMSDCYRYWLQLYGKAIRNLHFLVSLIEIYANQWQEINYIVNKILVFTPEFYYDSKLDVLQKRILEPLIWFGYVTTKVKDEEMYICFSRNRTT